MNKFLLVFSLLFWSVFSHAENLTKTGSYALYNYSTHTYHTEYEIDKQRPIASITKLFTAMTVIHSGVDLTEKIKVSGYSFGRVPFGMWVTRVDLMHAMLVSSDNRAAESLAAAHPGGFDKFLIDRNSYISSLGLTNTELVDASGLGIGNISTARDLIKFLGIVREDRILRSFANDRNSDLSFLRGKKTIKVFLKNTNPTLFEFDNILISKTGYTNPAGRCVIMLIQKDMGYYGVIILGQKTVKERSLLAKLLILSPEPVEELSK